ncbi:hypothetical protein [Flavobacterium sp. XGLA_31]|uniref:hypothetical protein n=1 Tax=Flavobacterium sp. XGLA_31 TaxID=3447666 RepID=UPI003F357820
MNTAQKEILDKLRTYLEKNPNQRFGQVLFNLGINEFMENKEFQLRDIYGDADSEILNRIKKRLELFDLEEKVKIGVAKVDGIGGMTVNERLYASDLSELFDEVKENNKEHAEFILKALKVDEESIMKILK